MVQSCGMKRFLFLPLLMLPIALFAGGGLPDKPYIYVKGIADVEKPADVVILRFNLAARAPEQVKATADVQARAAKLFALLGERKIAQKDVIAEQVRSEATLSKLKALPAIAANL